MRAVYLESEYKRFTHHRPNYKQYIKFNSQNTNQNKKVKENKNKIIKIQFNVLFVKNFTLLAFSGILHQIINLQFNRTSGIRQYSRPTSTINKLL